MFTKKRSKRLLALVLSVMMIAGSTLAVSAGSLAKVTNTINGVYYSGGVQIVSSSRVMAFMDTDDSTVYTYAQGSIRNSDGNIILNLNAGGNGGFYYNNSQLVNASYGTVTFYGSLSRVVGVAYPYV